MPQIRMRDIGAVLRTISRIRMRDAGSVLRQIQRVRMRDTGGVLRTVFNYFSVVLDTNEATGFASAAGTVTSNVVTGTVSGGVAPITYLWERIDGSLSISADAPTGSGTSFSCSTVGLAGVRTGTWRLKCTDNNGTIIYSENVSVELQWDI